MVRYRQMRVSTFSTSQDLGSKSTQAAAHADANAEDLKELGFDGLTTGRGVREGEGQDERAILAENEHSCETVTKTVDQFCHAYMA